jgi:hypothetical protein
VIKLTACASCVCMYIYIYNLFIYYLFSQKSIEFKRYRTLLMSIYQFQSYVNVNGLF